MWKKQDREPEFVRVAKGAQLNWIHKRDDPDFFLFTLVAFCSVATAFADKLVRFRWFRNPNLKFNDGVGTLLKFIFNDRNLWRRVSHSKFSEVCVPLSCVDLTRDDDECKIRVLLVLLLKLWSGCDGPDSSLFSVMFANKNNLCLQVNQALSSYPCGLRMPPLACDRQFIEFCDWECCTILLFMACLSSIRESTDVNCSFGEYLPPPSLIYSFGFVVHCVLKLFYYLRNVSSAECSTMNWAFLLSSWTVSIYVITMSTIGT